MTSLLRALDANANRAREALRVMEDVARFVLDHPGLTEDLKRLRHDFSRAVGAAASGIQASRDTPGDVGVTIRTPSEASRAGAGDVAIAAGKRLSEALRSLEEFAKALPPGMAAIAEFPGQIAGFRYRGYELERRLNLALSGGRARQWRLCVLLTRDLCKPHSWEAVLEQTLEAGADCVQIREKTMESGELLRHARAVVRRVRQATRAHPASVIVNDRPDIALLADADGVHVGQGDLPVAEVRKLAGPRLLVGVSTSRLPEAMAAWEQGADYCGVGPMFPTSTKAKDVIVGPAYLREYLAWAKLPHLAIAGVSPATIAQLAAEGCQGVAVSSAVCSAANPSQATRDLLAGLGEVAKRG